MVAEVFLIEDHLIQHKSSYILFLTEWTQLKYGFGASFSKKLQASSSSWAML